MKINTANIQKIIPVSGHTVRRFSEDSLFPRRVKIGKQAWYDRAGFYNWLDTRASNKGAIKEGDVILGLPAVCKMLGRSSAWAWQNITKKAEFTCFDLSPVGRSGNPRVYLIEREIEQAFVDLLEVKEQMEREAA